MQVDQEKAAIGTLEPVRVITMSTMNLEPVMVIAVSTMNLEPVTVIAVSTMKHASNQSRDS